MLVASLHENSIKFNLISAAPTETNVKHTVAKSIVIKGRHKNPTGLENAAAMTEVSKKDWDDILAQYKNCQEIKSGLIFACDSDAKTKNRAEEEQNVWHEIPSITHKIRPQNGKIKQFKVVSNPGV